jgi:hypoxanthine-guanine phosphoribosyltransferase
MRVFLYKKVSILLNQTHSSHKKKTFQEIWKEDKLIIDNIINYGYTLEVVWESDFDQKLQYKI